MIAEDVELAPGVEIPQPGLVNLYGCRIGEGTRVGAFVEIQKGVRVGARCKISSHSFLCEGVTLGDGVFVGHGVIFINDRHPRASGPDGLQRDGDWTLESTRVEAGASIGSGAVILCGLTIGEQALVGAGSVVTRDVPPGEVVCGVPSHSVRSRWSLTQGLWPV